MVHSEQPLPDHPVVLILGGLTTVARALAQLLLGGDTPKAKFVRIVDRFSVHPPTTYLDKAFVTLLLSNNVEYMQVNLTYVARHYEVFTPPVQWTGVETNWDRFDLVFDLTGEIGFGRPELLQISHTYQMALALATSAGDLDKSARPHAYVRLTLPFYEMKSSSTGYAEDDKLKPDGVRGLWWHEALRGTARVAKAKGLNFGVVRCAAWYGQGTWEGEVVPRLVAGHVYAYLDEEMKFLYNSDLRIHTVHTIDVAQVLYLAGVYLARTPQADAIRDCGVELSFPFSPHTTSTFSLSSSSKSRSSLISDAWKTVSTVVPQNEIVMAVLFNAVDDGDSTQDSLARAVASVWGVKYGFLNSAVAALVQQFAKSDFAEMVEDVNEKHVEAWARMLATSQPPIESSPISPFLEAHAFRKMAICLDGSKTRRVLGFVPVNPRVEVDELRSIARGFQEDGIWPSSVL